MSYKKQVREEIVKQEVSILDKNGNMLVVNPNAKNRTNTVSSTNKYVIDGVEIRTYKGLYNLNDVHLASKENKNYRPSNWLRV